MAEVLANLGGKCARCYALNLPGRACNCGAVHAGSCPNGLRVRRGKTKERGYGGDWRVLRAYKLQRSPLCEIRSHCNGVMAVEVDHKVPIVQRPEGRLDLSNLQSACKSCHSAKTMREVNMKE